MPMKLRSLTSWIVLCLVSWTFSSSVLAQNCVIENYALDTNRIDCDGSIQVSGQAFSEVIFGCDFEANGFGGCVGWQATPNGAQFDNPCDPPPPLPTGAPNATYLWMGPGVTQPRFVSTIPYNLPNGGQVCFYLDFAEQIDNAPCEGPDLPDEGVYLQWTNNGGTTWNNIFYFNPDINGAGGNVPSPYIDWGYYCFDLPQAAWGPNVQIRWFQQTGSTANFDHWGIDEVVINTTSPVYNLTSNLGNPVLNGSDFSFSISPTQDTFVSVLYTDGVDSCSDTIDVFVNPLDAGSQVFACDSNGTILSVTGASNVVWGPPGNFLTPNDILNPRVDPIDDQWYYVTSACDTDSVFVDVVPKFEVDITPPDTICRNGSTTVDVSTSPSSVGIVSYAWSPSSEAMPANGQTSVLSPQETTMFYVDVTSDSGCVVRDSTLVFVIGGAPLVSIDPSDTDVCPGQQVSLDALICTEDSLFDDFEGSVPNPALWASISNGFQLTACTPPSGNGLWFNGNGIRQAVTNPLNVTGGGFIEFWIRIGNEDPSNPNGPNSSCDMFENGDTVLFQYSVNGGATWIDIQGFDTLNFGNGGLFNIPIPAGAQTTATQFRWFQQQTGSGDNWAIDNVKMTTYCCGSSCFVGQYAINWQPDPTLFVIPTFNAPDTIALASPTETTTYQINVTDGFCVGSAAVTVFMDTSIAITDITPDTTFCGPFQNYPLTTSYNFGTGGTPRVTWNNITLGGYNGILPSSPFSQNIVTNGSQTMSFQVTISDDQNPGCEDRDTVTLTVGTIAEPTNVVIVDEQCGGACDGSITMDGLNGTPPYSYSIDSGQTFQSSNAFTGLCPGTYYLMVGDQVGQVGCSAAQAFTVNAAPAFNLTSFSVDGFDCAGTTTGSVTVNYTSGQGPYNIVANGNNVGSIAASTYTVTNLSAGSLSIQITNAAGCVIDTLIPLSDPNGFVIDSVIVDSVSCNGGSDGSITVYSSGGIGTISYDLGNGVTQSSNTFSGLSAGLYTDIVLTDANGCEAFATGLVDQPSALVLTVTAITPVSGFGASDGSVQFSANGGSAPYDFTLDGQSSNGALSFDNLPAGDYVLQVTDANGCLMTDSISVTEPLPLTLPTVDLTNIDCFGESTGSITLQAAGGIPPYNYSIDCGVTYQSSNVFTGLAAGGYSVTVQDNIGDTVACQAVVLTDNPLLLVSNVLTDSVLCEGDSDGQIEYTVQGGEAPYTFAMVGVPSQSSGLFTGLSAGNYFTAITDAAGCTIDTSAVIGAPDVLEISVVRAVNLSCFESDNGEIELSAQGGSGSLSIENAELGLTGNVFNALPAGLYTATVVDENLCEATVQIDITQPDAIDADYSTEDVSCFGYQDGRLVINSVTGGSGGYSLSFNSDTIIPNLSSAVIDTLSTGLNVFTIVDANDCPLTLMFTIDEPDALSATLDVRDPRCQGQSNGTVDFTVTGGTGPFNAFVVDPTLGDTSVSVGLTIAGLAGDATYDVGVLDANGCILSDVASLVDPSSVEIVSYAVNNPRCYDDATASIVIDSIAPGSIADYTFTLIGTGLAANNGIIEGATSGVYSLAAFENVGGCTDTVEVYIGEPAPRFLETSPDTVVTLGEALEIFVGDDFQSYSWTPNTGLSCSDCINPTVLVYEDVTYEINAVDSNGCVNENLATITVKVDDELALFVPDAFTPNGDGMNDVLLVYGVNLLDAQISIYNRWGELMFASTAAHLEGWDGTFKGEKQAPGTFSYILDVTFLNGYTDMRKGSFLLLH